MKTVKEVIQYFNNLYMSSAVYVWGMNGTVITPESIDKAFKAYGNRTYTQQYYADKLEEGEGRIGADCSGAFFPVSGGDKSAQGYYNACAEKGLIDRIDRNKPCMVFKGTASNKITHIGFYCGDGYVIEMKSSKDNCVKDKLDGKGWKFYGVPSWIDYGTSNTVTGIDISQFQGQVDFGMVKKSGIGFVIIRTILKSGMVDPYYHVNMTNATKYNMPVGVYLYSYDETSLEAIASANKLINLLNGLRVPIFLDLEEKSQLAAIGKPGIKEVAQAFIKTCENSGYRCYIYCNLDWYKNVLDDSLRPYVVWIARYGKNDGKVDNTYKPNVNEKIWQYSSKGQVPGISGNVDMNVCYDMSIFGGGSVIPVPSPDMPMKSINVLGKVTASSLNIRQYPNTESAVVGHYKNGDIIPLIGLVESNGWYKTDKGYVSGKYVHYLQGKVDNCNALNVRQYSNTSSKIITTVQRGTVFIVLNKQNDWYNILLADNTVGWVSGKYVTLI